ncbi:hypothetical protein BJX96DRAFT_142566 [Aspergillus floccosus]
MTQPRQSSTAISSNTLLLPFNGSSTILTLSRYNYLHHLLRKMEEKKDPIVSTIPLPPPEDNEVSHGPQSTSRLRSWCLAIDAFAERTICKYFIITCIILVLFIDFPDGVCRSHGNIRWCLRLSYIVHGIVLLLVMVISAARGYLRMLLEEQEASTAASEV